jgi:transposase InsO family protein
LKWGKRREAATRWLGLNDKPTNRAMKEGQEPGGSAPGSWRTGDAVRIGDRWRGRFMSGFGHPASYSALVALRRALIKYPVPEIHHSDQGVQYAATAYTQVL